MISSGTLDPAHCGSSTDLVRHLDLDRDADLTGHLSGHLLGHLLTLPVHLLLALGAAGVSAIAGLGLGLPLAV